MKRFMMAVTLCLASFVLTACGYSAEERQEMAQYEKQGKTNALNYVKEKYGFEADVAEVSCEKAGRGGTIDFSPPPTGDVFVTMEWEEKNFSVYIPGDAATSEGVDNYQYEAILSALEQELQEITNLPAEALFMCYGRFDTMSDAEKNGLIPGYFDGQNLAEVLQDQYPTAAVSYINQDVSGIDMAAVEERTGIRSILFVDYDSPEHYRAIEKPYYNIAGSPIESGIDEHMLYMNGYRLVDYSEDVYVDCTKKESCGVLMITELAEEQVTLTKTTIDPASEWNGRGFLDAEQVSDAYALNTESRKVHVYIPVDSLSTTHTEQADIVLQYVYDGKICYYKVPGGLTDDGNYLEAGISTKDRSDIRFAVLVDRG